MRARTRRSASPRRASRELRVRALYVKVPAFMGGYVAITRRFPGKQRVLVSRCVTIRLAYDSKNILKFSPRRDET